MILDCRNCGALVEAVYIKSYWDSNPEEEPANEYSFFRCPKCYGPFVVQTTTEGYSSDAVLYPQTPHVSSSLPKPIMNAFLEAQACFRSKAYTASTLMCRKTLEGICAAHSAQGKSLVSALRDLKDKGVIEQRLFEWADALRISGNEAAHDVQFTVTVDDARDILEFTNALLEYVFTFRDRFEAFIKRRKIQIPTTPSP